MNDEECPNCGEIFGLTPGRDSECPKCDLAYSWSLHGSDYGRWFEIEWDTPPEPEEDNQQPPPATGEEG